ncbi:lysozyme inhibitor LprI family protein [Caballeronia grimmiae]|uniref:hypothetical protein n=1 Tax=Caballeronia grimmiae TaxID=1071679 RepID=UPI0038BC01B7
MTQVMKWLALFSLVAYLPFTQAEEKYAYVGVAKVEQTADSPALFFPSNPAFSGFVSIRQNEFLYQNDFGDTTCKLAIDKQGPFGFDIIAAKTFGTPDKLEQFLSKKFRATYSDLSSSILLGDSPSADCRAFRYSKVYQSKDAVIVWGGDWMYMFRSYATPPRDATQALNCLKATSALDRSVCANSHLVELDASVNLGFVEMQDIYSKEISYEDPVRLEQIQWIRNVRNKCANVECLEKVYRDRVDFFKKKVSSRYPSYPMQEKDPQYD